VTRSSFLPTKPNKDRLGSVSLYFIQELSRVQVPRIYTGTVHPVTSRLPDSPVVSRRCPVPCIQYREFSTLFFVPDFYLAAPGSFTMPESRTLLFYGLRT